DFVVITRVGFEIGKLGHSGVIVVNRRCRWLADLIEAAGVGSIANGELAGFGRAAPDGHRVRRRPAQHWSVRQAKRFALSGDRWNKGQAQNSDCYPPTQASK